MLHIFIGIIVSLGLAYWVGNTWRMRAGVLIAMAIAVTCYGFIGSPSIGDRPLHQRLDEMRKMEPKDISGDQWIALLQQRAKVDPEDPQSHKFIGDILMQQGKPDEALLAYQSALRRDPKFVDVLTPMADALVAQQGGRVTEQAQQIYIAAFSANTADVKAAFMPGMRFWLDGDRDGARDWWAQAQSMMPEGSPEAMELKSQVDLLQQAMANVARQKEEMTDDMASENEDNPSEKD